MRFNFAQFVDELDTTVPGKLDDWTDAELTELFEERAAIAEFDGGLSRHAAETTTLDWLKSEIGEIRYKVWGSKPNNV
jgi:hypothetical protein